MTIATTLNGSPSLTAEMAAQWVIDAQPGATVCYASGYTCGGAGDAVLEQLRHDEAAGFLHFKQQRRADGQGFLYLAERSSRPLKAAKAVGRR